MLTATTTYNNDDNSTTAALQIQVKFVGGYEAIMLFRDSTFPRGTSMMFP